MAYRKIDPRLWDDEKFVELTTAEKLLWLYLLTGPHTTSLPGLWTVGLGELVDGLRLPAKHVEEGLRKLERMGRLVLNPRLRLVRVPNAPRYNRPDNARVLKAWFKLWSDIPECQQKYDHLESLRGSVFAPGSEEGIDEQATRGLALIAQWESTFAAVVVPEQYLPRGRTRPVAKPVAAPNVGPSDAGSVRDDDSKSSRTAREHVPNSSPALALVTAPAGLPPEKLGEAVLETARDPAPVRLGTEAASLLAKLRSHESLGSIADERTAIALAGQVLGGRVTLVEAEKAVDDAGYKYAAAREHAPKTPAELVSWVAGCVGHGGSQRGAQRSGRHGPPRGAQPQPGPMQVADKGHVPPEEQLETLV